MLKSLRAFLLWPLGQLYRLGTDLRNLAFRQNWLPSQSFPLPVLVVGNLSTGGTGKTPFTEFLIRNLPELRWAVVSRGYGRHSRGVKKVDPAGTPAAYGDEPLQIARNFPDHPVWVAEKRPEGMAAALQENPAPEGILLDDAFQHRYVKGDFHLLLTTAQDPFFEDHPLPAGNLRESRQGAQRAQAVVVTKWEAQNPARQQDYFRQGIKRYTAAPVFFSHLHYLPLRNAQGRPPQDARVVVLTGIARPETFLREIESQFSVMDHLEYPDHHHFSEEEIDHIESHCQRSIPLITTQKDYIRLQHRLQPEFQDQLYYLPVETALPAPEKERLLQLIRASFPQP